MSRKPRINSASQRELDTATEQLQSFEDQLSHVSNDIKAKPEPVEMGLQVKKSNKEINNANEIYLKPTRTIFPGPNAKTGIMEDKFNEKFRKDYEFQKEQVRFIAENLEIIGEVIVAWTRPFPGMPAEEWKVPVNKPVWGPRYLAEQIRRKNYRKFVMGYEQNSDNLVESSQFGSQYGKIAIESTERRLDARPAPKGTFSEDRRVSNF